MSDALRLYFNPRSRARIAKWMLDEAQLDYELVPIEFGPEGSRSPEYLAINPSGKVPSLADGDTIVFETAAIGTYLAERYPDRGLAPLVGDPARAKFLSMMFYASAQLEPAIGDALLGAERHRSRGWTDLPTAFRVIETMLGDGPYLLGDSFSLADIMIGASLIWYPQPLPEALAAYVERLRERPHAKELRS